MYGVRAVRPAFFIVAKSKKTPHAADRQAQDNEPILIDCWLPKAHSLDNAILFASVLQQRAGLSYFDNSPARIANTSPLVLFM